MGETSTGPDAVKCLLYQLDMDKSKGGAMSEWPEDLRIREFPKGEIHASLQERP